MAKPLLSDELWEMIGEKTNLLKAPWPKYDPDLAKEDELEIPVQVNGKLRGRIHVVPDIAESAAVVAALAEPAVAKFVGGTPRKIVFVPGRLLNIVV